MFLLQKKNSRLLCRQSNDAPAEHSSRAARGFYSGWKKCRKPVFAVHFEFSQSAHLVFCFFFPAAALAEHNSLVFPDLAERTARCTYVSRCRRISSMQERGFVLTAAGSSFSFVRLPRERQPASRPQPGASSESTKQRL